MRFLREVTEVMSETSPLTLGALGLGVLIAGPVISSGLRAVAVTAAKGVLEITDQARNISSQAKNEWGQMLNEARQQPSPNWSNPNGSTVGASVGGAIGAGLGSTAGPVGAAAGGGLGAGVGATVGDEMNETNTNETKSLKSNNKNKRTTASKTTDNMND